jgi:hypothetical protein
MYKLLVALLVLASCKSQQATQRTITLDFATDFPKEKKVPVAYKEKVTIEVNNVNRKLFKVETTESKTDFNVAVPEALKGIKLPGFLNLSLPSVSPDQGQDLVVEKDAADTVTVYEERIKALFDEIENKGTMLNAATLLYNQLNNTLKTCNLSAGQVQDSLNLHLYTYLQLPNARNTYPTPAMITELQTILNSLPAAAAKAFDELQRLVPNYIRMVKAEQQSAIETQEQTVNRATRRNKQEAQEKLRALKTERELFQQTETLLKEQMAEAKELVSEMRKFEAENKIEELLTLARIMNNTRNFSFTSEVIESEKDETRYKITIIPEGINACGINDKKTAEVVLQTAGGLKIDFSTGVFILGGRGEFLGDTYYWENIDANTRKIVKAERGSRLQLGIGALAHFYKRSYKPLKGAFSMGVSTTSGFDDLNFQLGPSLIFGNKDRLILTAGLALKSVRVLDKKLQVGVPYEKENSPDDIPTVSQFPKTGWFVGLTYNLSRLKSE